MRRILLIPLALLLPLGIPGTAGALAPRELSVAECVEDNEPDPRLVLQPVGGWAGKPGRRGSEPGRARRLRRRRRGRRHRAPQARRRRDAHARRLRRRQQSVGRAGQLFTDHRRPSRPERCCGRTRRPRGVRSIRRGGNARQTQPRPGHGLADAGRVRRRQRQQQSRYLRAVDGRSGGSHRAFGQSRRRRASTWPDATTTRSRTSPATQPPEPSRPVACVDDNDTGGRHVQPLRRWPGRPTRGRRRSGWPQRVCRQLRRRRARAPGAEHDQRRALGGDLHRRRRRRTGPGQLRRGRGRPRRRAHGRRQPRRQERLHGVVPR